MTTKKLSGIELDNKIRQELELMLLDGYGLSPISRSAIQKRLGLTSRGTLAIKHRAEMIENARIKQLNNAKLTTDGKKRRNDLKEQNERLKLQISELLNERDNLVEKLAMIINGIQAKGYNLEELMMPLRNL